MLEKKAAEVLAVKELFSTLVMGLIQETTQVTEIYRTKHVHVRTHRHREISRSETEEV